jgi:hypothetical protein
LGLLLTLGAFLLPLRLLLTLHIRLARYLLLALVTPL